MDNRRDSLLWSIDCNTKISVYVNGVARTRTDHVHNRCRWLILEQIGNIDRCSLVWTWVEQGNELVEAVSNASFGKVPGRAGRGGTCIGDILRKQFQVGCQRQAIITAKARRHIIVRRGGIVAISNLVIGSRGNIVKVVGIRS